MSGVFDLRRIVCVVILLMVLVLLKNDTAAIDLHRIWFQPIP